MDNIKTKTKRGNSIENFSGTNVYSWAMNIYNLRGASKMRF
jgi:hypothetical protein